MLNKCRGAFRAPGDERRLVLQRFSLAVLLLLLLAVGSVVSSADAANIEPGPIPDGPGLPEGRVYEQVSPVNKNGNQAGPAVGGEGTYGVTTADGSRVLYASTGPIGEASSGVDNFSYSERTASGWTTKAALPQPIGPPSLYDPVSPFDPTSLLTSADLSKVAFTARNPFAPSDVNFANPKFSFSSTYLAEVGGPATWVGAPTVETPVPALEEVKNPTNLTLVGASTDLSVLYYEYYGTLLPEDGPRVPAVAGGNRRSWGLYEWRDGVLKAAGILPTGEEDPFGAMAAAIGENVLNVVSPDFQNEVSESGNTLLFVSPAPEAESGRLPQLYARIDGERTVLVSRSSLTGMPSTRGAQAVRGLSTSHAVSYAYGTPDGSRVFFPTEEQLTNQAPSNESTKEYEFDLADESLNYVPGLTPPILASSPDGNELVFDDHEEQLAIWEAGQVHDIAPMPPPSQGSLYVAPVKLSQDGSTVVFQTNSPIPGFNDEGTEGEIYRYDRDTDGLTCVSCPPKGQPPVGASDVSNDALHHQSPLVVDSRGMADEGDEIFFDTPDQLVPQDVNGKRDVYEWHDGHISLISSGTADSDSLFLDNSASGNDVFFMTKDALVSGDTDGSYDIYDARVDGGFPVPSGSSSCTAGCTATGGSPSPIVESLASTSLFGPGEQIASSVSTHTVKVLSRAQKLVRSLRVCRRKRGRPRRVCERQANRRYGKRRRSGRA